MGTAARLLKLAELRAKTDRDLVIIIGKQVERALAHAAEARRHANDSVIAERSRVQAEQMCTEALRFLSKVEDPRSRGHLETKLDALRQRLKAPEEASRRRWASAYC